MWIGIDPSGALSSGTYRFTFTNIADIDSIPLLEVPSTWEIAGKRIQFTRSSPDRATGKYIIEFNLLENPEPITVITVGIILVLGLTVGYMSLQKVEKLVESPAINIGIIVLSAGAALWLWRSFKRGV